MIVYDVRVMVPAMINYWPIFFSIFEVGNRHFYHFLWLPQKGVQDTWKVVVVFLLPAILFPLFFQTSTSILRFFIFYSVIVVDY